MYLISPYINFGAWYWKISIRWITIFDELEKFSRILFQPSHLPKKTETKRKKKPQKIHKYRFWYQIECIMKHQSQSNSSFNSILHFISINLVNHKKKDDSNVVIVCIFVFEFHCWVHFSELICVIAFIMESANQIETIFHRLTFICNKFYIRDAQL